MEDLRENYSDDLKGHQYVALRILREVDRICRKNNLKYWITDGTLLGAIRHKGFIPWDDDIDIGILREDEERFIEIMKKELSKEFFLQTKETDPMTEWKEYIKIRDRYSKVITNIERLNHEGIWIDVFIFDKTKKNKILDYLLRKFPTKIYKTDVGLKKGVKIFLLKLFQLFRIESFKNLKEKIFIYISSKEENNSLIYYKGVDYWITYYIEDIFPLEEIEFEGYKFFKPKNHDNILKELYGKNYMELPPLNKRITHTLGVRLTEACEHKESLDWNKRKMNND